MSNDSIDTLNDIEKLLEIAESSTKKIKYIKEFKKGDVEKFITDLNIKPGDSKIPTYTIYYRYYEWKKNKRTLMTRQSFFKRFKLYFEGIATQDGRGYLLDPSSFDLTPVGYFKARSLLRRQKNGRKKEES